MLFKSVTFTFFFTVVFYLYWTVFNRQIKLRNLFLLLVSYVFYGFWDWRFLSLIVFSSLVDYIIGYRLGKEEKKIKRKILVSISLFVNLGVLVFFKYYNFFIDSFVDLFGMFGMEVTPDRLDIILPVGISFYTFQTLSYTIDVYRKKIEATSDVISFFTFVSFFPQLVAGPIERAKDLLPQFSHLNKANYDQIRSGFFQMAWGFFKKIVIADRLAIFIDNVYASPDDVVGIAHLVAALFFAFQLYLDFSAYSDIAIGISKTLGFKLSENFKRPYLSSSFSDFWGRWHISLSSWFRDYLYIPLGGNKEGSVKLIRNILIVFILSGLWHGATWNFVIWGLLNALFMIIIDRYVFSKMKFGGAKILIAGIVTSFWTLSLIFFRAKTFDKAMAVFKNIGFSNSEKLFDFGLNEFEFKLSFFLLIGLMIFEIIQERKSNLSEWFRNRFFILRWSVYLSIVIFTLFYGAYGVGLNDLNFIYFQF